MSIAPYLPSAQGVVIRMLELAEVKPDEVVYDLGCGDGRIVITAAKNFGARGVGIEIREDLAIKARRRVKETDLQERVEILCCSLFDVDISPADVVTIYLSVRGNDLARPKLEKELKAGSRVVSHEYALRGWVPTRTERFMVPTNQEIFGSLFSLTHTLYLYRR